MNLFLSVLKFAFDARKSVEYMENECKNQLERKKDLWKHGGRERLSQWRNHERSLFSNKSSVSLDDKSVTTDEVLRLLQKFPEVESQSKFLQHCRAPVEKTASDSLDTSDDSASPPPADDATILQHRAEIQRKRELWEHGGKNRLTDWRYDRDHSWRKELHVELISVLQQRIMYLETCNFLLHTEDGDPFKVIDQMNGFEFEVFCAELLKKVGFEDVSVTQASCDQGVDILATRDDVIFAIQCKDYSSPVGNSAVQQVYAGKTFYHCHVAVVMTNSYFTESALELAEATGVILWNRRKLEKFLLDSVK